MSVQSVALASLTATYTDSEGEDGVEDERLQEENSNTPQGAAPHNAQVGRQPQARSGTSPISGGRSASHSPAVGKSAGSSDLPEAATKVQRLVSYFDDVVVSDDEGAAAAAPPSSLPTLPTLPTARREFAIFDVADFLSVNVHAADYEYVCSPGQTNTLTRFSLPIARTTVSSRQSFSCVSFATATSM